jgi:hypothetical protein
MPSSATPVCITLVLKWPIPYITEASIKAHWTHGLMDSFLVSAGSHGLFTISVGRSSDFSTTYAYICKVVGNHKFL